MCLAIPGKITAIKKGEATVDYGSQKTTATIIEGDYKEGDYVIVQGRIVVEKVPESELKQWMALYEK
jgi:hydrogenase maturation factor